MPMNVPYCILEYSTSFAFSTPSGSNSGFSIFLEGRLEALIIVYFVLRPRLRVLASRLILMVIVHLNVYFWYLESRIGRVNLI
jgi:hypothetical protein